MCDNKCRNTQFRGAGNSKPILVKKAKQHKMMTSKGLVPVDEFIHSVTSTDEMDPAAYYGMIGVLKQLV